MEQTETWSVEPNLVNTLGAPEKQSGAATCAHQPAAPKPTHTYPVPKQSPSLMHCSDQEDAEGVQSSFTLHDGAPEIGTHRPASLQVLPVPH